MATTELPRTLYTADEVRKLDRIAIEEFGIPGQTLMERAGQAAFSVLQAHWPEARTLAVFCGNGNNGGDGFVIATLAQRAGLDVHIYQMGELSRLKGEAAVVAQQAAHAEVPMTNLQEEALPGDFPADVIVDALLGTGLTSAVRSDYQSVLEAINNHCAPVFAVDIPSGLCADTGNQMGMAVRADVTTTFIGVKRGLVTGRGPALSGDLYFDDLSVPHDVYSKLAASACRIDLDLIGKLLPPRDRDAHKGRFGHVLVVAGDYGLSGAAIMASEAAARIGAGLVSVATRERNCPVILSRQPEVMAHGVEAAIELKPLLQKASVVVIGPGLGQGDWGQSLLQAVLQSDLPLVVDADALNLLADAHSADATRAHRGNWVLTPHPGEAGRLLDTDSYAVQQDRFAAVEKIHKQYGGSVVLKGAGSIVHCSPDACPDHYAFHVAAVGNPGMASGGMGDVLSGVIGGLVAQGLSLEQAGMLGALIHGAAADLCAAEEGERGMLATDLLPWVRRLANGMAP